MQNYLQLEPKSGTIKVIENGAMYLASAAVSQHFKGVVTMSDFNPDCVLIPLSKTGKNGGKYTTIVSPEDAVLADWNWSVRIDGTRRYVNRSVRKGERKSIALHRVVLERMIGRLLEKHEVPDHINGNGLDNRRENLRVANAVQNAMNRTRGTNNMTGHRGVGYGVRQRAYRARITVNGKTTHLGWFKTFDEACLAYQTAAKEYHGDFTSLRGSNE